MSSVNQTPEIIVQKISDDGTFPNNADFPLLLYKNAFHFEDDNAASYIEEIFRSNGWSGMWRNGIYNFHHYHSTAHEVLGIYSGAARIQFGGPDGIKVHVEKGDVVVIPAGVAHKNFGSSVDFRVVGAYPAGQNWDMNYGRVDERPTADKNIKAVAIPRADPVYGSSGPLLKKWKRKPKFKRR